MSQPDLSIVVPARGAPVLTQRCLGSLLFTLRRVPGRHEVLLIDDASPDPAIASLFLDYRAKSAAAVRVFRFEERAHYTGVFNLGLARAEGRRIFFLSNDMQVTPHFLNALLGVAGLRPEIATVRGTSTYTDSFPEYKVVPPFRLRGYEDILAFSDFVSDYHGLSYRKDRLFSGDAVIVNRAVLEKIGGFDPQFYGYYSDFDFGLRAQQAGFELVCAQGAWLFHEGAGHVKDEGPDLEQSTRRRDELIQADYLRFRSKWEPQLPEHHLGVRYDFERLRQRQVELFCALTPGSAALL
ncbi:hypothetical protein ABS71_01535 [bacterium SCN 62-11]|nr:glycosyltransferase [Candidatus Eremiobacteraeota bacterium]ODT78819.1 MAG: hypothetical protein ABS71_01535 [bacterium SCN 62-11]